MYRHIKDYEIKFTDADAFDRLKPSSLLSFLEESACLSADELGFGYDDITPHNLGFVIVNYYIELFRPIMLGERVTVHTWPLKPGKLIFLRDFELYCGDQKVGVATTRWGMVDLRTFALAPISRFFKEGFFDGYNTERSVNLSNWKIADKQDMSLEYSKKITFSDYDHYFHVNNTKYADFMTDTFSIEELKDKFIKKLQITYVKQCKMGEELQFFKKYEDGAYYIDGKSDGETRVKFRVELDEIPV